MTRTREGGRRVAAACLIAATMLGLAGCGSGDARGQSAILITLDTVRADSLSCYGGPPGLTPNLDRLASEGVLYESAYTVTPLTLPAHVSMLTGLYPIRHTLRNNGEAVLPASAETLAESARTAGLQTAAIIAAVVLDDAFGIDQGFEHYDTPRRSLQKSGTQFSSRTYLEVLESTKVWLRSRDRERPFFLWVHLWDAHHPWNPPPEFARRGNGNPYLGDVAMTDHGVGLLMDAFREEEALGATVLCIVGDHGEAFMEHGELSHGVYCYEPTLRVPMIVRYPDGLRAGERSTEVVSVADVMPTLADALGVDVPSGLDGESLHRRRVAEDRGVYFESYYGYLVYDWSPVTGWIDGRGKYLHSSDPELFDVALDPTEKINLVDARSDEIERYRTAIREVASRPVLHGTTAAELDPETQRMISDLGYALSRSRGVDLPHPLMDTGLAAPSTTADELRMVLRATDLLNAGKIKEAEAEHRRVLQRNPDNYYSLEFLATLLIQRQRFAEAVAPLRRVMASDRGSASAAVNLGICMRATKDEERAIGWFLKALELDANNVRAIRHLYDLYQKQGEAAKAEPYARRYEELTGDELAR